MSNRRILYLMSGSAHMPYLVCSLWTLRKWWDGEIEVVAWPESYPFAKQVAADPRLDVNILTEREPKRYKKNSQFIDKIALVQSRIDVDQVMYLDADTTIHGSIEPLFAWEGCGFVATRFNEWVTTGNIIRNRIKRLREFPELDQFLVEEVLANSWPSVNGGVWVACPESRVLSKWYQWTITAKSIFIADETCLHALLPFFLAYGDMAIVGMKGQFNCSPKYISPNLDPKDVVIWHFHGDSNVRVNKSMAGVRLWWPIYRECMEKNVGGIRDWRPGIKNKYLKQAEEKVAWDDTTMNWC